MGLWQRPVNPGANSAAWQAGRGNSAVKVRRVVVRFAADGGAALGAHIVVLVAVRQDEQELLAGRRGAPAARTEEAGGLEFLEAVSRSHHDGFYTHRVNVNGLMLLSAGPPSMAVSSYEPDEARWRRRPPRTRSRPSSRPPSTCHAAC